MKNHSDKLHKLFAKRNLTKSKMAVFTRKVDLVWQKYKQELTTYKIITKHLNSKVEHR